MNKKRFTAFANHLELFTQRIVTNFPDTQQFIENEKKEIVEKFPEIVLKPKSQPSQPSQITVIRCTMKSSVNPERRKATLLWKTI